MNHPGLQLSCAIVINRMLVPDFNSCCHCYQLKVVLCCLLATSLYSSRDSILPHQRANAAAAEVASDAKGRANAGGKSDGVALLGDLVVELSERGASADPGTGFVEVYGYVIVGEEMGKVDKDVWIGFRA